MEGCGIETAALHTMYTSPSILQTSILRPPLIIRPLDLAGLGFYRVEMYFYPTMGRNRVNMVNTG